MSCIPSNLLRFIEVHIHSVEQLEVLLLLRLDPTRFWNAESVSRELRTSPESAAQRLADLRHKGFIVPTESEPGAFCYQLGAMDATIGELADCYKKKRIAVIEQIFRRPRPELVAFSNAFDVRKKEEE